MKTANNYRIILGAALVAGAMISAVECGGGGGGNSASGCVLSPPGTPIVQANVRIPESTFAAVGRVHTNFLILNNTRGSFAGFTPDQIRTAYGIPSGSGSGVVTIVEAFDNPNALADLNEFSAAFGLPQESSSDVTDPSNQHLQIVYATGSRPKPDTDWSQESALDMEWVHAMAPNAKIIIVEAPSGSPGALINAVDVASAIPNAHQCSNSWSMNESSTSVGLDNHFQKSGVVFYFASGDTGGARDYPPTSPYVVSVGGTTLTLDGNNHRVDETAWSGTGCGFSNCEPRPQFQDIVSDIVGTTRGVADVAAVADPSTGVRVRWHGNWLVLGGTSASCPIVAGIANASGTNRPTSQDENAFLYSQLGTSNFFDVTTGKAGMFNAAAGWDFPTGVGVPNGVSGF